MLIGVSGNTRARGLVRTHGGDYAVLKALCIEWLTQCGAGKKTARRYMSNAFSLSSKGSGCLII
mgnify:CR=1 FL=1